MISLKSVKGKKVKRREKCNLCFVYDRAIQKNFSIFLHLLKYAKFTQNLFRKCKCKNNTFCSVLSSGLA